ncbi:hypothetical protein [Primorskyibacter sp. S87]|uniref:hypothetical protein n=1 Tax=Primorskyibacter sp. S87 TaxID=3415126 RepID=UPI003C7EA16C
MKTQLTLAAAALVLAGTLGCTRPENRVLFDGLYFPSKSKAVDKKVSRAEFTATVNKVSQSFDSARKAAEYEGIRYCIVNYGTSRIDWLVGPDTDPAQLRIEKDSLTYQGTCKSV